MSELLLTAGNVTRRGRVVAAQARLHRARRNPRAAEGGTGSAREPIAVIGIGCRFPGGGDDAASLWRLLRDGVDAIGQVPAERWDIDALRSRPRTRREDRHARRGISSPTSTASMRSSSASRAREAQGMDPQQRLLLEVAGKRSRTRARPPIASSARPRACSSACARSDYAYLQLDSARSRAARCPLRIGHRAQRRVGPPVVPARVCRARA